MGSWGWGSPSPPYLVRGRLHPLPEVEGVGAEGEGVGAEGEGVGDGGRRGLGRVLGGTQGRRGGFPLWERGVTLILSTLSTGPG